MKKLYYASLWLVVAIVSFACLKDKHTRTYTLLEPVYMDKATVLASISSSASRTINDPGKIYKYGSYLFLNEVSKGVHIIDNSNPANPVMKAFISIPGNVDIAVKGNILFADLATDLVTIDISDPLNARLQKVVRNVFPERQYVNNFLPDTSKYIVDWTSRVITESIDWDETMFTGGIAFQFLASSASNASPVVAGTGGSMARFAIVNDYMYAVSNYALTTMNVQDPANPVSTGNVGVGMNIETIYPFKQKLFIGSSNGMFIYNINNPAAPQREGAFAHARACDPVVADDNYAFVTLRSGTFCQGTANQLDVINVQNVTSPSLVKTYGLTNPFGLAKDGNLLFICDGKDGLKLYNAANVNNLQLIKHVKGPETFDVIAWDKKLIMVAKDGLYQYSYTDAGAIQQLSKLSIARK